MDNLRQQIEASLNRSHELIMEDRYRRLQCDPVYGILWPSTDASSVNGRFKRHLPAFPNKRKCKNKSEDAGYQVHSKDKYGSVSAHSTSAIYGALRAPQYTSIYSPSEGWYASVRSLSSLNGGKQKDNNCRRPSYNWYEPIYEDVVRESCPDTSLSASYPKIRRSSVPSMKHPKSRPNCTCCSGVTHMRSTFPLAPHQRRKSVLPEKVQLHAVTEENDELRTSEECDKGASLRHRFHNGSRIVGNGVSRPSCKLTKMLDYSDQGLSSASRRSILECEVTAYDLIKKSMRSSAIKEVDSDLDDDLSDNAVDAERSLNRRHLKEDRHLGRKKSKHPFGKLELGQSSKDMGSYCDSSRIRVGGQGIFSSYQPSNVPSAKPVILDSIPNGLSNEPVYSIPEPDYDSSEESDGVDRTNFQELRISYSPPPIQKCWTDNNLNLPVESKSIPSSSPISSLPCKKDISEEGVVNSQAIALITDTHSSEVSSEAVNETINMSDNASTSDISSKNTNNSQSQSFSSDITESSTSPSDSKLFLKSTELRSILKKANGLLVSPVEEIADVAGGLVESSESQKKKQVQFSSSDNGALFIEHIGTSEDNWETEEIIVDNTEENIELKQENSGNSISIPESAATASKTRKSSVSSMNDLKNKRKKDSLLTETDDKNSVENKESEIHLELPEQIINDTPTINTEIDDPSVKQDDRLTKQETRTKNTKKEIQENLAVKHKAKKQSTKNIEQVINQVGSSTSTFDEQSISQSKENKQLLNKKQITESEESTISKSKEENFWTSIKRKSTSLDDLRETTKSPEKRLHNKESKTSKKQWLARSIPPNRRFSDLHLQLMSLSGFSSVDRIKARDGEHLIPRIHKTRSLPDSPIETEDSPTFCFEFRDKTSKGKVNSTSRSTFYVPVETQGTLSDDSSSNDSPRNSKVISDDHSPNEPEIFYDAEPSLGEVDTQEVSSPMTNEEDSDHKETTGSSSDEFHECATILPFDGEEEPENEYEVIEPIYEELTEFQEDKTSDLTSLDSPGKSFFEGASKTDILSYLENVKERGLEILSSDDLREEDEDAEDAEQKSRILVHNNQNQDRSSSESTIIESSLQIKDSVPTTTSEPTKPSRSTSAEVERNDSGVGAETSKPARLRRLMPCDSEEQLCADCDQQVEPIEDELSGLLFSPLVCKKCDKKRCERKEIITEIVDTELKYGRDLRIICEEFFRPMEIAGLLSKDQLLSVFLNLEELVNVNAKFSEKLQDALDIATEQGDEDYTTVNIGKLFVESSSMLHAFETYCVKQSSASVVLSNLEKEKELLRIFLRVSQMENTLLRRMNLPAFLMVPVQRVTKYPLLLSRLYKVTPYHHQDREALREAQLKMEQHLEHINQQTKGVGGIKLWRKISNISVTYRRPGYIEDIGSIRVRKMALEVLKWNREEVRFVMVGKLLYTQVTDYPWNKKGKALKFTPVHALLVTLGKPNSNYRPEQMSEHSILFPKNTGIRDATLLLMKEKNGRCIILREPLHLGSCVISADSDSDDVFEVQEYNTKEAYLLKGESKTDTREWLKQLRYHAKDLGSWRRRRNALANIMINGMVRE